VKKNMAKKSSKPTSRFGERSSITGRFVKDGTAAKRPNTNVRERIPFAGHGDSGRGK
jgi:hypothetical protein